MYGKKSLTMIIIKLGSEEGADNYACAQLNIFASHKIKIHYFFTGVQLPWKKKLQTVTGINS